MAIRMTNRGEDGAEHDKSALCDTFGCTPVEEKPKPKPKRRMMGPKSFDNLIYNEHVGEHPEMAGCDVIPKCTPINEAEKPMKFEITTKYTIGEQWSYRMAWVSVGGSNSKYEEGRVSVGGSNSKYEEGFGSRDEAKRAAEEYADEQTAKSLKPETYTYEGKIR